MTGREAAAEALDRALLDARWPNGDRFDGVTKRTAELIAPTLLAAIERGDIPGVTLAAERRLVRRGVCTCGEVDKENRLGHADGCRYFADSVYEQVPGVGVLPESETLTDAETEWFREECVVCLGDGCRKCEAVRDEVDRIIASRARPASVDAETLAQDLHARHHDMPGNLMGRDDCGYEGCDFYAGALAGLASGVILAADREPDGLRAKVEALEQRWSAGLDDGCPSCGPVGFGDCDHAEGYHHALGDLRALLAHPATDQEEWKPRAGTVEDDLRSRLGCVMEATYWDRPYEERIAAIQGMCDLTTDGMTAADQEEADRA